jgi:hypothetical protein
LKEVISFNDFFTVNRSGSGFDRRLIAGSFEWMVDKSSEGAIADAFASSSAKDTSCWAVGEVHGSDGSILVHMKQRIASCCWELVTTYSPHRRTR